MTVRGETVAGFGGASLAVHRLGAGRPGLLLHGLFSDANTNWIKFGHAQFNMFGPKNDIYRESMEAAVEVFEWVARNCKRDAVKPGGVCMAMYEAADTGAVTQEEAEVLVRTLYSAGSDTTIYQLGNTLRALAEIRRRGWSEDDEEFLAGGSDWLGRRG